MNAGIAQRGRTQTSGTGGARPQIVRCAIYTRKSSDEGLEQAFNSLDAQREACAAYVLSQASEGWVALPDIYDDGGLSGGTLERPALKRLLAEVAAGSVDIIVVYKVDRLTRSLFDFAKLVETFDAAGTSFVSVTQSFNTTTSMGRLTLNMLLSFAQFEREVTAERIRDKIAASKAKGMWMGGTPPLGYAPDGRTLTIIEEHAALVRHVYQRYLVLGSVRTLQVELQDERRLLPVRARLNGNGTIGGGAFTRGQLYKLLSNPVYAGRIAHGSVLHPGRHPPIIDQATWDAVQARLADNRQGAQAGVRAASPSLLAGLVTDEHGTPLISSHSVSKGKRYRYYQSRPPEDASGTDMPRTSVPASELESAVAACMAQAFDDPFTLADKAKLVITAANTAILIRRAGETLQSFHKRDRGVVRALVSAVRVHPGSVEIEFGASTLADMLEVERASDAPDIVTITAPVTLARTGRALRLIHEGGAAVTTNAHASLIKLLLKARGWWQILRSGELDIKALAAAEGVQASYVTRVVRLAFLSPAVVQAILGGTLRAGIDAKALTLNETIPACWNAQAARLLPVTGSPLI